MTVTGYQIREALRRWQLRLDTAVNQFSDSLSAFENEVKDHPTQVMAVIVKSEAAIAKLQEAQARYNLAVNVEFKVGGTLHRMLLLEAVKRIGGAGRVEKMWRTVSGKKPDRYSSYDRDNVRQKDSEYAQKTIHPKEAMEKATEAAAFAGALRGAIAEANARPVEVEIEGGLLD